MRHLQTITIDSLPASHQQMRGLYLGETEDGCSFQLYVNSGTRQASGNQMMRAHVDALRRGRPLAPSDLRVNYEEIYVIVGRGNRKDINVNPNGTYSHGNIFGRNLPEIVSRMIQVYGPRPRPSQETEQPSRTPSGPKPF